MMLSYVIQPMPGANFMNTCSRDATANEKDFIHRAESGASLSSTLAG